MISFAAGETIFARRDKQGVSLTELAAMTGIAEERLQALEEGESMTLHEVFWLIHALPLSISSDPSFHIVPGALVRATPHG